MKIFLPLNLFYMVVGQQKGASAVHQQQRKIRGHEILPLSGKKT